MKSTLPSAAAAATVSSLASGDEERGRSSSSSGGGGGGNYGTWSSWTWRRRKDKSEHDDGGSGGDAFQQDSNLNRQRGTSTLPLTGRRSAAATKKTLSTTSSYSSPSAQCRVTAGAGAVMAGTMVSDATAGLWHAFDFLDEQRTGQVPKSKLKVLTANLGTVLNCPNVENGLQDHRSTSTLSFDDYMYYLRKELFSSLGTWSDSSSSAHRDQHHKHLSLVEEVCWLVCRARYLKRDDTVLTDQCVFQLFRIFCMLAEQDPSGVSVMSSDEVHQVVRLFVVALGKTWDPKDFEQISQVVPTFRFAVFLALLENSYAKDVEELGLIEATQEIFDMYIEDVLKKSFLSKKGHLFSAWRVNWYVLRPTCLTSFADRTEKDKRGEIPIHGKCSVEPLSDAAGSKGNRFVLICGDKCFELSAADHKTKLQWITAIQTAIDHHGHRESYQRLLASRRHAEREAAGSKVKEDECSLIRQQDLLQRQRSELEAEKLARLAAETQAMEQADLRQLELERLREVEAARKDLERLLEEERQAKRDEEIVRNLQARLLREEWEKREELERLQEEQKSLLAEERTRREGLEQQQQIKELALEAAGQKLRDLEEEKNHLDRHLSEAQEKIVVAERAKEILEAKLRVRDKSLIPLPVRASSRESRRTSSPPRINADSKLA